MATPPTRRGALAAEREQDSPTGSVRCYRAYLDLVERPSAESVSACTRMVRLLTITGRTEEARSAQLANVERARELADDRVLAKALRRLGSVLGGSGEPGRAEPLFVEAEAIAFRAGDLRGQASALAGRALLAWNRSELEQARLLYREALSIERTVGDPLRRSRLKMNLAGICHYQGLNVKARELALEALALARQGRSRLQEMRVVSNLAILAGQLGSFDESRALLMDALRIATEIGDRRTETNILQNLGALEANLGNHAEARGHYRRAMALAREVRHRMGEGIASIALALAQLWLGQPEECPSLCERARVIFVDLGDRLWASQADQALAVILRATGGPLDRVEEILLGARQIFEHTEDRYRFIENTCELGYVQIARGGSAAGRVNEARRLVSELGLPDGSQPAEFLAQLEEAQSAFDAGARMFAGRPVASMPDALKQWLRAQGLLG